MVQAGKNQGRKGPWALVFVLLASACPVGPATAQELPAPPEPPREGRESERGREFYEQRSREGVPEAPLITGGERDEAAPAAGDDGPRFVLREIRFTESEFLAAETLREIAGAYVGREVGFGDLQELVRAVNAVYQERGLLTARAVIPPQRIENGVVTVRLVEGRLGRLLVEGNDYTSEGYVRGAVDVAPGEVLDVPALTRSLRYFNEGSDVRVSADLRPGAEFGQTDVALKVIEPPRAVLQVFADNTGSISTGREQAGVSGLFRGLLGRGDHVSVYAVGAKGSLSGSAAYSVPLFWGGRLELSYTNSEIEIIQGAYTSLDITGESDALALRYEQPVWLGEQWTVHGIASLGQSESTTFLDGVPLSETTVDKASLGARVGYSGEDFRVIARQSVAMLQSEDILGESSEPLLLRGGLSYVQRVSEESYGLLEMGWQYASESRVPASEVFQIGGLYSVRGHPQGALTGTHGVYAQAEWRWQGLDLSVIDGLEQAEPFVFLDHGQVWGESPEHDSITGAGAGLVWQWGERWSGEVTYGYGFEESIPEEGQHQIYLRLVWNYDWL